MGSLGASYVEFRPAVDTSHTGHLLQWHFLQWHFDWAGMSTTKVSFNWVAHLSEESRASNAPDSTLFVGHIWKI
jgi:hypothetical protein